jgi:RNA polymerase sigma factor (sigma-70 family)
VEDRRTDAELLAATHADPEAFAVFYRRHLRAVLAFLLARTRRPDLAADVCAETFAAALERRGRFDERRGPARAWLLTMAHSRLIDALRRGQVEDGARRRLGMPARELTDEDLERVEELAGLDGTVNALVEDLPAEQREAVLARVVSEREYAAIARDTATSEAVIRQRVSRGLRTLRGALQEEGGR